MTKLPKNQDCEKGITLESVMERFMAKVDKEGPTSVIRPGKCWLWTGAMDQKGYPRFKYCGLSMYANRMNFIFAGEELSCDRKTVSLCQNRACVNPAHHALGTNLDAHALRERGRVGQGYQWIYRDVVSKGEATPEQIAEWHELSPSVVRAIVD